MWFKMVAQLEVEEPDIVLVEDLVAWLSNAEAEKNKREKCRRQLEARAKLANCVQRVLDLGLYSATLTDEELAEKVSLKGNNQRCVMRETKNGVQLRLLAVAGVCNQYTSLLCSVPHAPHTKHTSALDGFATPQAFRMTSYRTSSARESGMECEGFFK
jgi:hypothetical protein